VTGIGQYLPQLRLPHEDNAHQVCVIQLEIGQKPDLVKEFRSGTSCASSMTITGQRPSPWSP